MTPTETGWTAITGSTGGIGSELVEQLASKRTPLVLINRSEAKAQAQRASILGSHPDLRVELVYADLMDTAQIDRAVAEIESLPGPVDALYNNSGILTAEKVASAQGFESQFAVNTLAPYQLIRGLQRKMARTSDQAPAMVVNFASSVVWRLRKLDVAELAHPAEVGGLMSTYAQTKLATTTFSAALADELRDQNILIRAIDPGATKTAMTMGGNSGMPSFLRWIAPLLFRPVDQQTAKVISSADPAAHEARTGIFVANRKERKMPAPALDESTQADLLSLLDGLLETAPQP